MLGFAKKVPVQKFNSIYYAPKPARAVDVKIEPREVFSQRSQRQPDAMESMSRSLPMNFQKTPPLLASQDSSVAKRIIPTARPTEPAKGLVRFEANKEITELRDSFYLMEKILQEQATEITQLRGSIASLTEEIQTVRDEVNMQGFGTLDVRFLEDSLMLSTTSEGEQSPVSAGTVLQIKSPFQETEEGLWGVHQVISVSSEGMEIRGFTVLIARANSRKDIDATDTDAQEYTPLIEILDSTQ
jgi:hypothetical protein